MSMMNGNPTRRQVEVLAFIRNYIAEHKCSPYLTEIGAALELRSLATVHKHLRNLSEKGLLTWQWNKKRSIRLCDACPACGREFESESAAKSA
jgi:SOS-response transcriptional repressor LexA